MKTFLSLLVMMIGVTSSTAAFAKACFVSDAVAEEPVEKKGDAAYYWFFKPSELPKEFSASGPTVVSTALFRVQLAFNKEDHSLTYVFEQRDAESPDKFIPQPAQVVEDVDSLQAAEGLPIHSIPVQYGGIHFRAEFGCR